MLGVHVSGGLDYNYAEACDEEMLSSITRWLGECSQLIILDLHELYYKHMKNTKMCTTHAQLGT